MFTRSRSGVALAAAFGLTILGASAASAHTYTETEEIPAGGSQVVDLVVPHGCDGEATESVDVQLPASVITATPVFVPGWTATVTKETLDEPVTDAHGNEVTERTAEISWAAGDGFALPDGQILTFGIRVTAPDAEGEMLYFKTIQTCANGTADWIEEWDGTGEEPDNPAPAVMVGPAEAEGGHGGEATDDGATTTTATGAASSDTASTTDDDDGDEGSSNGLSIAALVVALGGAGLGGTALARSRKA